MEINWQCVWNKSVVKSFIIIVYSFSDVEGFWFLKQLSLLVVELWDAIIDSSWKLLCFYCCHHFLWVLESFKFSLHLRFWILITILFFDFYFILFCLCFFKKIGKKHSSQNCLTYFSNATIIVRILILLYLNRLFHNGECSSQNCRRWAADYR